MTSSLVGSEMCIRDSVTRATSKGKGNCNRFSTDKGCHLGRTCPYEHPKAVSYTHLTLPTICSV
eukprot:9230656-Prorocentrum_lima.AAC.1